MSKVKESPDLREQALQDAADNIAMHNVQLRSFLLRLTDPEDLGHAVSAEVRRMASALVLAPRS
jgi:hypothetical protein